MTYRFNPFRPGGIVAPGMFCGRIPEIEKFEQSLFQTKNGNPHHFLIHGERGIGKSSLLFYFQKVADGTIPPLAASDNFKFLIISVELEPTNSYYEIINKIGAELNRVIAGHQRAREMAKVVWDFIKRWEVMGVKYSTMERSPSPQELLDELVFTVIQTWDAMKSIFDGIFFLIDEADKPAASSNMGEFVKLFTEKLSKRGCNNIAIGLAGLPTLLQKLRESHESAPRIFDMIALEPLLPAERVEVVQRGLNEAREKNGYDTIITPEAAEWISNFSEGYPHFIQQFSFSAFDANQDNIIDVHDVLHGAFQENGAFQQLGQKYFQELYFDQIGSDEYREVLRVMSEHGDGWVTKKHLQSAATIKQSILHNAINALKNRHIIIPKPGTKGCYRLPTKSFAVWIKAFTRGKETTVPSTSPAKED